MSSEAKARALRESGQPVPPELRDAVRRYRMAKRHAEAIRAGRVPGQVGAARKPDPDPETAARRASQRARDAKRWAKIRAAKAAELSTPTDTEKKV